MLTRKRVSLLLVLLVSCSISPTLRAPPQAGVSQQTSLYRRLGGYDGIAALTDDLFARVATDPQLSHFFKGHSSDTQKRQRQHVVEFLCAATGGPCFYTGRDMKTTHTGLGITESDWDVLLKHLQETFDKLKVQERERSDFLTLVSGLKTDVVGK